METHRQNLSSGEDTIPNIVLDFHRNNSVKLNPSDFLLVSQYLIIYIHFPKLLTQLKHAVHAWLDCQKSIVVHL